MLHIPPRTVKYMKHLFYHIMSSYAMEKVVSTRVVEKVVSYISYNRKSGIIHFCSCNLSICSIRYLFLSLRSISFS